MSHATNLIRRFGVRITRHVLVRGMPWRPRAGAVSTSGRGTTVNHRLLAFVLCLIPAAALAQQTPPTTPAEPQVTVSGQGLVQAVPDRAWITISAESRASNPRDAQRRNTEAMTPVLEKLKAAGVQAEAIRTIGYDVQYEWD